MNQRNLIQAFRTFALTLACATLAACGGGGSAGGTAQQPVDENYQLLTAYTNLISAPRSKTYTVSGTLVGLSYAGSGSWAAVTTSSLFNNSFAYAQKITYNEAAVSISNVAQAPSKSESINYFDSNYRFVGTLFDTGVSPIDQIKYTPIPTLAKIGESGSYLEYSTYSDNTKKTLTGVTSERWGLESDTTSPTGAVLKITRTVVFADKVTSPNPLIYTDRYSITKSGSLDLLTRNISWVLPGGNTNYTYIFK